MQAQALLGSLPPGTVRTRPSSPSAAMASRLGVRASSRQVLPPRSGRGCPAAPSIIRTMYFIISSLRFTTGALYAYNICLAGRSAAWLARRVRDAEVGGSNPLAPTISIQSSLGLLPERNLLG